MSAGTPVPAVPPGPRGPSAPLVALVFAGGRGSRLGGRDKAELTLAGERLVDRAVAAARGAGADPVVVVGPATAVTPGCLAAREEPPFGGPLAALAAGLRALPSAPEPAEWALLLSCDLVSPGGAVSRLIAAPEAPSDDAVVLRDPDGRAQWLAGRYRLARLADAVDALGGAVDGAPLRRALDGLAIRFVDAPAADTADIDTPEDLARARARTDARPRTDAADGRDPESASPAPGVPAPDRSAPDASDVSVAPDAADAPDAGDPGRPPRRTP